MTTKPSALAHLASITCLTLGVAVGCGGSTSNGGSTGGEGGGAGKSFAGAGGTMGRAGSANAGSAGDTGGAPGASGAGASGGAGACSPACAASRQCCGGQCVNEQNDPHNCGGCGITCEAGTYCGSGQCTKPMCEATCTGNSCCGMECCTADAICCDPQGPLDRGPHCVAPSATGTCPMGCAPACVCASPDTPIATPAGERAIASLRVGDLVYSIEGGAVKAVPILRIKQTSVENHHVMRVKLATGATLEISGGHPTADGRSFADLRAGSMLDGVPVITAEKVAYSYASTFDILPASSSETYFAGGALIGSTIDRATPAAAEPACVGSP